MKANSVRLTPLTPEEQQFASDNYDVIKWGTGKARKRPREVRTPVGQMKNNTINNIAQKVEEMQA